MEQYVRKHCRTGNSTRPEDISGPWLEIDLDAITHNIQQIKKRARGQLMMPVIKANAYGHGIVEIGRHLDRLDVFGLCVGKFQEAETLRKNDVACPILNLGIFSQKEAETIVEDDISQVVFDDRTVYLHELARKMGKVAKVHIKIDTGLGRIGVPFKDALEFIRNVAASSNLQIEGIYTSLTEEPGFDKLQIERFKNICMQAEGEGISPGLKHAASSAGLLAFEDSFFDMVRPGIMVFGCYPSYREFKERKIDLKPALTLKARAAHVKKIEAGESVSYHRAHTAETSQTIVTGSIGYSDGYPLGLARGGSVLISGKEFSLIAAVTANHIYINGGKCDSIKSGDEIVLLGCQGEKEVTIENLAALLGTSEYQILSGINPTLPRFYMQSKRK